MSESAGPALLGVVLEVCHVCHPAPAPSTAVVPFLLGNHISSCKMPWETIGEDALPVPG
jgi:hypothetical protein